MHRTGAAADVELRNALNSLVDAIVQHVRLSLVPFSPPNLKDSS